MGVFANIGWSSRRLLLFADHGFARSTADGHATHGDAADAAGDAAVAAAVSTALDDLAAGSVAGGAVDAHTICGLFDGANATAEVDTADSLAIHGHIAAHHLAGLHGAEVLHHGYSHGFGADAVNLDAGAALFHADGAAGHHHHVGHGRHRGGHGGVVHRRAGHRHSRNTHHTRAVHGHSVYHTRTPFRQPAGGNRVGFPLAYPARS